MGTKSGNFSFGRLVIIWRDLFGENSLGLQEPMDITTKRPDVPRQQFVINPWAKHIT